jgi:hypothetical protein
MIYHTANEIFGMGMFPTRDIFVHLVAKMYLYSNLNWESSLFSTEILKSLYGLSFFLSPLYPVFFGLA